MKKKYGRLVGSSLLLLVPFLLFAFSQQGNASEPIKIGVIAPMTGPFSPLGQEAMKGVEIARDMQNAKGGIKGRKIDYLFADTPDTSSAIAETERLISQGVKVVVAAYNSSLSFAMAPIAERNKVVSWHVNASSDRITQQGIKYLFRTNGYGSEEGSRMAAFARDCAEMMGIKPENARVAIIFEDGVYGTDNAESGREKSKELGMNVVHFEGYNRDTQDLSSLVMRLKQKNPDILLMTSYAADTKIFLRQAKTLDLKLKVLVGTGGAMGTDWFRETYGQMANGFVSGNWPVERTSKDYAPGMPDFVKTYKERYGRKHLYSAHSATGYTGMLFLWDVLERAKSLEDSDSIRQAALDTDIPKNKIGCGWGAQFAPPGHKMMGTNLRAETIVTQWQDNELWTVWPIPYPGRKLILPVRTTLD